MARRLPILLGLVLICVWPAHAQTAAAPQPALDAFNDDYQRAWTKLLPPLRDNLQRTITDQLASVREQSGGQRVRVLRVRNVRLGFDGAPGFSRVGADHLELAIPVRGHWKIEIEADVRVGVKILGRFRDVTIPIRLIVDRLRVSDAIQLDLSDPARPVFQRVAAPQTRFRVRLSSRQLFYRFLLGVLTPVADRLARRAVVDALQAAIPGLASLQGFPGPVPGDGVPLPVDSGAPTQLPTVVANVDLKVRRDHLPHGTLLVPLMDTPVVATWEDAYGAGGAGNVGQVVGYKKGKDSALHTGLYLASQVFRALASHDPDALDNVRHAVAGIGNLLDVYGGTGLLARRTAPLTSLMGQEIAREPYRTATLHGQTWVVAENNHISRDQYSGVFFGLSIAYDLLSDPVIRADCGRRLQQMTDYLVARDWYVDEDRPLLDPTHPQGVRIFTGFPTFFAGNASMKLAFLHAAQRVAPGRYDAEVQQAGLLTPLAWVGTWTSTLNLDGYYKFNLAHITDYNYFRLETDPARWQDMARAFRIQLRYVGHHQNPHFELIQTSVDPSLRATRYPSVREGLRRFLRRNHRKVTPAVVDTSGITWVTLTLPSFNAGTGASSLQQVTLPSEPLDPAIRYQTDFIWQRTPFNLARPNRGDPHVENAGLDLLLPYWMGRHQGAF